MNLKTLSDIVNGWKNDSFVFEFGFSSPHSYRGYYEELSFEPTKDVSVKEIKEAIHKAYDETFLGWKGGEYTFWHDSSVNLSFEGEANDDTGGNMENLISDMQEVYRQQKGI